MTSEGRRRRVTATVLFGVVAGMVALSFASVPLYRLLCQATGIGGTPRTENIVRPDHVADRVVTVRLDTNVSSGLPWQFKAEEREVALRLGEERLVHFIARNTSDRPVTGTATFVVLPEKVAQYFNKLECFCFQEQTLQPGQEVSMPVVFFVDPALIDDVNANEVTQITLSYTFLKSDSGNGGAAEGARAATERRTALGGS